MSNDKAILLSGLQNMFARFQKSPYSYFYEEDIRVELASDLKNALPLIEVLHNDQIVRTSCVKCEYPSNNIQRYNHDIVFVKANSNDIYNLEISVALEIKLGSNNYDRCKKFKKDIRKLRSLQNESFTGICIYFFQDNLDVDKHISWYSDITDAFLQKPIDEIEIHQGEITTIIVGPNKELLITNCYK